MRSMLSCLFLALVIALPVAAQEKPVTADAKAPVFTEVQQLQFTNAAQAKELWMLKAQQAADQFQKANEALNALIGSFAKDGYDLTQNKETGKLEYVKKAEPAKGQADKK